MVGRRSCGPSDHGGTRRGAKRRARDRKAAKRRGILGASTFAAVAGRDAVYPRANAASARSENNRGQGTDAGGTAVDEGRFGAISGRNSEPELDGVWMAACFSGAIECI